MASLNLSTNGPSISKSYQAIVNAPPPSGPAASSPTYGQWAVFSVSAPLANAFQQDSGNKESVLKVQSTGEGELLDLVEEFSDGRIQFAFVKVKDSNSGLPKSALIAWCGEGVPERTKGYFTSHLTSVSKLLHGYHVQITARSDRDLTPEGIIQKVADASGSNYSGSSSGPPPVAATKPVVASKPVFTPTQSSGMSGGYNPVARNVAAKRDANTDADGWGSDAPQITRTQLEKVQSAYQPTKVDMRELTSQKPAPSAVSSNQSDDRPEVVRGAYQPVGKVDIAAIRRQAQESGRTKDDRPEIVKGAYEPVGKVDIAAIRAKAQKPDDSSSFSRAPPTSSFSNEPSDEPEAKPRSLADRSAAFSQGPERLTSLPKPKVANKFGGGSSFGGTKAPAPGGFEAQSKPGGTPQVGAAGRSFAESSGKTPAQIWAEKKARERGMSGSGDAPLSPTGYTGQSPIPTQPSGGNEWKSGYEGKSWATVQTSRTGASSIGQQVTGGVQAKQMQTRHLHPQAGELDRFATASVVRYPWELLRPQLPPQLPLTGLLLPHRNPRQATSLTVVYPSQGWPGRNLKKMKRTSLRLVCLRHPRNLAARHLPLQNHHLRFVWLNQLVHRHHLLKMHMRSSCHPLLHFLPNLLPEQSRHRLRMTTNRQVDMTLEGRQLKQRQPRAWSNSKQHLHQRRPHQAPAGNKHEPSMTMKRPRTMRCHYVKVRIGVVGSHRCLC